jgi:4-hydroxybenzoate polyprenyltransferase
VLQTAQPSSPRPARIVALLSAIKFSHTIFALPFALLSAFLASGGLPPAPTLGWILLAMVGARSAAMSFNRLADRELDSKNPRTSSRELPAGTLRTWEVSVFCLVSVLLFLFSASRLNRTCLLLTPVALAIILGYSFTKRFTWASHLVLGLGLSLAPAGAWIAVTGRLEPVPILLSLSVLFWVAGFDVIYSLQDEAFDRGAGLSSLPARFGAGAALRLSVLFHALTLVLLYGVLVAAHGGTLFGLGILAAGGFLIRQHTLVSPTDLSRVDAAFFTANGWLSVVIFLAGAADVLVRNPH